MYIFAQYRQNVKENHWAILRLYVWKRRKINCKEPGGTADFSRSIESVWYGFSGINKKAAPPWGRNFGTQKRLICAASIRSKMAAASRAAFSTSLWAAMP